MKNLLVAVTLITSTAALSQEKDRKSFDDSELYQSKTRIYEGESMQAREGKKVHVAGKAGWGIGAIPGAGVEANYMLSANSQMGLNFVSGSVDLANEFNDYTYSSIHKAELSTTEIEAQYRHFFGNSFFLNAGLGYRQIRFDYDIEAVFDDSQVKGTIESNSVATTINIGNMWAFDSGITIGARWIGVSVPLSNNTSVNTETNGQSTSDSEEHHQDAEDLGRTLGETTSIALPMLHLGYMF